MRIPFTKMQGTGNDFVVIDETLVQYHLSAQQYQFIANRHFGVGADQILSVRTTEVEGLDFEYVIHNADGSEVEHCGNGARCFLRFPHCGRRMSWNSQCRMTGGSRSGFLTPRGNSCASFTGSRLVSPDGLPLLEVSSRNDLRRVSIQRGDKPESLGFLQGNGSFVEEFSVSGLDDILPLDAGGIDLP